MTILGATTGAAVGMALVLAHPVSYIWCLLIGILFVYAGAIVGNSFD